MKKRIFKRLSSAFLAIAIIVVMLPSIALPTVAASEKCGENLSWSFSSYNGTLTISGTGDMYDYTSSSDIPWNNVRSNIKSLVIKNGVVSLHEYATWYLTELTTVTVGRDLLSFGAESFGYCNKLTKINVDTNNPVFSSIDGNLYSKDGETLIKYMSGKTDTAFSIPEGVSTIDSYVFADNQKLTQITLPNSVAVIGSYAFKNCTKITEIDLPDSVKVIGFGAFYGCTGITEVDLPDSLEDLGRNAFSGCGLELECENKIYYLDDWAVSSDADITSATLRTGTKGIAGYCFYNCTQLSSVIFNNELKYICAYSFASSNSTYGLGTSLYIPKSVEYISSQAIYWLTSPSEITVDPENEFYKSLNGSLYSKDGTILIRYAGGKTDSSFSVPYGVTVIGDYAFEWARNLTDIRLPDSVTNIGTRAFQYCTKLNSIDMSNSITDIDDYAFWGCTVLTSIALPKSIRSLGECALRADKLSTVIFCGNSSEWEIIDKGRSWCSSAFTEVQYHNLSNNKCTYCGEACQHIWNDGAVLFEPTCSSTGAIRFECTLCGITKNEVIPMIGHYVITGEIETVTALSLTNSTKYPFALSNGWYSSTNKDDDTTSTFTITALCDCTLELMYRVSSEEGYDKLRIKKNNSYPVLVSASGVVSNTTLKVDLVAGDKVTIEYDKDDGGDRNADTAYFKIVSGTEIELDHREKVLIENLDEAYTTGLTCDSCQEHIKLYHTHSWDDGSELVAPTHLADGIMEYTCTVCNETKQEPIAKIEEHSFREWCYSTATKHVRTCECGVKETGDHTFDDGVITVKPTPDSPGVMTYTCSICNESKMEKLEYVGGYCGPNARWTLDAKGTLTVSGKGEMYEYLSSDLAPWYSIRASVKNVIIEDGITTIGSYSFYLCNVSSVSISDSVTSIGHDAFYGSSLNSVIIPDSVEYIGSSAFSWCEKLQNVTLGQGVKQICSYAFCATAISSVNIPRGIITIEDYAFVDTDLLTTVYYGGSRSEWAAISKGYNNQLTNATLICAICDEHIWDDGVVASESTHLVEGIKNYTCTACGETKTEALEKLPDHTWDDGVITIEPTHTAEGIKTYTCECGETRTEAIEKLADHEWNGGIITTEPTHFTEGIKTYTCECGETKTEAVEKLPDHEWDEGVITTEPTHSTEGIKTFTCGCGETKTEAVEMISHDFSDWSKQDETYHVRSCECGEIEYGTHSPDGNYKCTDCGYVYGTCGTNLVWEFDENTGVLTISGNGNMTSYPWKSAYEDSITTVIIESGVTGICNYAFAYCDNITGVDLPTSITSIGSYAFASCRRLASITIPDGITKINNNTFYNCVALESITVPASVTIIGNGAFESCTNLKTVILADNIELSYIGYATFDDCKSLENVIFGENSSLISINANAFYNCASLVSINLPNSITNISEFAFYRCTSLTSITLPEGLTTLSNAVFSGCSSLTSIIIPDSVTSIGNWAFSHCTSLASITIPNGVRSIGNAVFQKCSGLATMIYCGAAEQWETVTKGDLWNDGVPATVRFHNYSDGVCTECGEACTHIWDDGVITTEPTHLTEGVKTFACECGITRTEVVEKLSAHVWDDGVVTTEPTHMTEGVKTYTCECGETRTETVERLAAHEWGEGVVTVQPTYVAQGVKTYTCTCGLTKNESVDVLEITAESPKIIIDSKEAIIGGTVKLVIRIENNPGVWGFAFELPIDTNVFEFVSADTSNSIFKQFGICSFDSSTGTYKFNGQNSDFFSNAENDGIVTVITLKVKDDAVSGEYELALKLQEENIINSDDERVSFAPISGTVEIKDYILGDVSGDGLVTNSDVLKIFRYIYNAELYPLNVTVADVNGDGIVTNSDVLKIYRYIYNPELYPIG